MMTADKPMMISGMCGQEYFQEYVVNNFFRNMWSRIDTLDDDGGEELGRST